MTSVRVRAKYEYAKNWRGQRRLWLRDSLRDSPRFPPSRKAIGKKKKRSKKKSRRYPDRGWVRARAKIPFLRLSVPYDLLHRSNLPPLYLGPPFYPATPFLTITRRKMRGEPTSIQGSRISGPSVNTERKATALHLKGTYLDASRRSFSLSFSSSFFNL